MQGMLRVQRFGGSSSSSSSSTTTSHVHSYGLKSWGAANCVTKGYEYYQCSCGNGYYKWLGYGLNHVGSSTSTTAYPTCTTAGSTVTKCTGCGKTLSTGTLSALGHNYAASTAVYPTCTTEGSTLHDCTRCSSYYYTSIAALGHTYGGYHTDFDNHWKVCGRCSNTAYWGAHYDNDDGNCNTCGYKMYYTPSTPTITVKDINGNVITSTWINKDLKVSIDGSSLAGGRGGVGYNYKLNNNSYTRYSSPVSYTAINTDTTFYAQAYNTSASYMNTYTTRVLPKIEKELPTFSISIDSSEYEKSHTATIKFADTGGSKLKATSYTVSYTWTSTTATPSSYANTMTVAVAESNQTTATITKSDGTGIYHLHVKINKQITDNATNVCPTTTLTIPFYMDNTAPVIEQKSIQSNPVALNSKATYSMDFLVTEEHSGLVTSEFVADDIVVRVNGKVSTAKKVLTYKSVSNSKYEYNLVLSNITETGPITLTIKSDSVPDYATNKCVETPFTLTQKVGNNFVGPYGDNSIPVVSMPGEVTLVQVPTDKNLSGVLDKRYVNQYYTVEIPLRILDIGGQDFTDILEIKDLIIKAGTIVLTPSTKVITLNSETTTPDTVNNLTIYQKDYTLTLSGLLEDGFLELTSVAGSVQDLATNVNVETKFAPYTNATGSEVRVLVDNIFPQPTIKGVSTPEMVNGETSVEVEIFIKDLGSGIRGDQFDMSDMVFQIDGATVTDITKTMEPSASNNYQTALGQDNISNYTYNLSLSNIDENGNLRIQIKTNNIIDKANNGNDPVTLEVNTVIDNKGPKLGPIVTNADKNGEVFGELVELEITDCSDPSGIEKYEWQRSEDGINFETIYVQETLLPNSKIEDSLNEEKSYYYRVIVSDTLGNTSTSEIVEIKYRNNLDAKPTIRLTKEQIDSTKINIKGVIKSKTPIVSIRFDGSELPKSSYEDNVKVSNYEITTTFIWPVTQNGIYEVVATDEKGNVVEDTINVNEFDFTESVIKPEKKDATLLTPAQIIFTSNEPVRIIDDDAYTGITFDTDNFSTRIIATVAPEVDFNETKIFEFENKGLTKVDVPVEPPLITSFAYLRFAKVSAGSLNMTVPQMNALTLNMRSAKMATSTGQIKSYYGFINENVNTKIATQSDIKTAEDLGNATETFVINENGQLVKLAKDEQINVLENGNYTTGNVTGMYQKTAGLLENYTDTMLNDNTLKYSHFRLTIVP